MAGPGTGTVTGALTAEYRAHAGRYPMILNAPAPGRIEILSDGTAVATVQAGPDGGFSARVPAGRYTVRGPATAAGPCTTTPGTLRVRLGKASHVLVFCPRAGRPK
jgi:hypothetical protein